MSGQTKSADDSKPVGLLEAESALRSIYCSIPASDEPMQFELVVLTLEMVGSGFERRRAVSMSAYPYYLLLRAALNLLRPET